MLTHMPQQPLQNRPSGHLGGWATPWSAEDMLDGQHQRVNITVHARAAHNGLLQKRLEENLCWIVSHFPLTTSSVKGLNWTGVSPDLYTLWMFIYWGWELRATKALCCLYSDWILKEVDSLCCVYHFNLCLIQCDSFRTGCVLCVSRRTHSWFHSTGCWGRFLARLSRPAGVLHGSSSTSCPTSSFSSTMTSFWQTASVTWTALSKRYDSLIVSSCLLALFSLFLVGT